MHGHYLGPRGQVSGLGAFGHKGPRGLSDSHFSPAGIQLWPSLQAPVGGTERPRCCLETPAGSWASGVETVLVPEMTLRGPSGSWGFIAFNRHDQHSKWVLLDPFYR